MFITQKDFEKLYIGKGLGDANGQLAPLHNAVHTRKNVGMLTKNL